ncbi:hypothetical protein L9F63_019830, partial [Diploptera punctata]
LYYMDCLMYLQNVFHQFRKLILVFDTRRFTLNCGGHLHGGSRVMYGLRFLQLSRTLFAFRMYTLRIKLSEFCGMKHYRISLVTD